ncbi:MAG: hypothetical protein ACI956_001760, partial [Nonlabens sp.]
TTALCIMIYTIRNGYEETIWKTAHFTVLFSHFY